MPVAGRGASFNQVILEKRIGKKRGIPQVNPYSNGKSDGSPMGIVYFGEMESGSGVELYNLWAVGKQHGSGPIAVSNIERSFISKITAFLPWACPAPFRFRNSPDLMGFSLSVDGLFVLDEAVTVFYFLNRTLLSLCF